MSATETINEGAGLDPGQAQETEGNEHDQRRTIKRIGHGLTNDARTTTGVGSAGGRAIVRRAETDTDTAANPQAARGEETGTAVAAAVTEDIVLLNHLTE
jgi:hypothetical protein